MSIDGQKLADYAWAKCLLLSADMQYSKSKVLAAEYDAYADIWNRINNGEFTKIEEIGVEVK